MTSEANNNLESLHGLVDEISESNVPTSVQLRALISRQHDAASISCPPTSDNIPDSTSNRCSIDSSSASRSTTSFNRAQADNASIFSTYSIRSSPPSYSIQEHTNGLGFVSLGLVPTPVPHPSLP